MTDYKKKTVLSSELFDLEDDGISYIRPLIEKSEFPWEILPLIKSYINKLIENGIPGFREIADGVLVGEGVSIHPSAVIIPPVIIGPGTEIRPGAYLRGAVITGPDCVIGNSCELKNCILLRHVQVPHYNYVGDSVLGNYAHMGAGSICSNLKSDGKNIVVHGDDDYMTGMRKIGGILGDHADIGCQCVINPGTVIGCRTTVYPLTSLRGVIPEDCIVKSMQNIIIRKDN